MILRALARSRQRAAPRVPEDRRVYAIGDLHGRADLLRLMHATIEEDAARRPDRRSVVVYLGDYVDRGLESRAVIEMLSGDPLPGMDRVHLMGNHDAWMLRFLDEPEVGLAWLQNGGAATLFSYGVGPVGAGAARLEAARDALTERLPPRHRAFLEGLRPSHAEGDYLFVHAGIRPGVPMARQTLDDLLWIREPFLLDDRDHGMVVVHGHTIVDAPEVLPNRVAIDTGAFATGRLTCLVLEGESRRFLQT